MTSSIVDICREIEGRGLLKRERADHSDRIIAKVGAVLGREVPPDLADFYRERVAAIGEFPAIAPAWNDKMGWRTRDELITELIHVQAMPIFSDGCGNLFGLDLAAGDANPAVYFFDHERGFEKPEYAAGSSLGAFLLLLADHDRALDEGWPAQWELGIDPGLESCPRAPAIWGVVR